MYEEFSDESIAVALREAADFIENKAAQEPVVVIVQQDNYPCLVRVYYDWLDD